MSLPVTSLLLIPKCPLDPGYQHTKWWPEMGHVSKLTVEQLRAAEVKQYQYFESIDGVKRFDSSSYSRVSGEANVVRVAASVEECLYYNYLAIYNAVNRFDYSGANAVSGSRGPGENVGYDTGVPNIKAFYGFITDITYVNDACCDIHYKVDSIQTWGFRIDLDQAFVKRCHVANDGIGEHTVPENLDCGHDIVVRSWQKWGAISEYQGSTDAWHKGMCIVILASKLSGKTSIYLTTENANVKVFTNTTIAFGVYNSLNLIAITMSNAEGVTIADTIIKDYVESGWEDCIASVYTIPSYMMSASTASEHDGWAWMPATAGKLYPFERLYSAVANTVEWTSSKANIIPAVGYKQNGAWAEAHNKKLYSYPYCYLLVSNGCGEADEFKIENWQQNISKDRTALSCDFTMVGVGSGSPTLKLVPRNHRGLYDDLDSSVTYSRFPECAWVGDAWAAYWAQNKTTAAMSILSQMAGGGASSAIANENSLFKPAMLDEFKRETARVEENNGMRGAALKTLAATRAGSVGAGTAIGVGTAIGGVLAKAVDLANTPPQVHGQVANDAFNVATDNVGFKVMCVTPKDEYIEIIDRYFDMYGYEINIAGVPPMHNRKHFTFTQTVGMQVSGAIPAYANNDICKAFDNGITWWVDMFEIGKYNEYAADNTPLGN